MLERCVKVETDESELGYVVQLKQRVGFETLKRLSELSQIGSCGCPIGQSWFEGQRIPPVNSDRHLQASHAYKCTTGSADCASECAQANSAGLYEGMPDCNAGLTTGQTPALM